MTLPALPAAAAEAVGPEWAALDPHDLGELYQSRATPGAAKAAGAFYTPPHVARLLAAETLPLVLTGGRLPVVLDPACGCGSLLIEALRFLCAEGVCAPEAAIACLRGCDRDQVSVALARAALLLAARELGVAGERLAHAAQHLGRNLAVRNALLDPPPSDADCVLLNPPYVRAARSEENREALRRRFSTAVGAFDLHVPFIELALRCVRPGGAVGLLTSNKYLTADYGRALRRALAREATVVRLIDLADCADAGAGAQISQLLTIARRRRPEANHEVELLSPQLTRELAEGSARVIRRKQTELLLSRRPVLRASEAEARLVARMTTGDVEPLRSVALVRGGVRGFDYHACCRELVEAEGAADETPVLCPGNVRAYRAPSGDAVRLAGRRWLAPCFRRRPEPVSEQLWRLYAQLKLVVKGVGSRPTAAWVPGPAALLVAVWGIWAPEDTLHRLLAVLNSRPAAWLHHQQLYAARIPEGSLRIPLSWVAEFPVPRRSWAELGELERLRSAAAEPEHQGALQRRIDAAVADAYGLDEADRALMAKAPLRELQV